MFKYAGDTGLEVAPGCTMDTGAPEEITGWTSIEPQPGAILCQLGDMIQYWSDGTYKSTFHRVRMPKPEEYQVGG